MAGTPSEASRALGAWIRERRAALGLTVEQLGDAIDTDKGTMSTIETGQTRLADVLLRANRIAEALQVPPEELHAIVAKHASPECPPKRRGAKSKPSRRHAA